MIALPVTCPVFIGRHRELAALMAARKDLAKSRGSIVLVGGEAGVGKSRLVTQFLLHSGDRRVRYVARAECAEGIGEPLSPIRTIVQSLLRNVPPQELPLNAEMALGRLVPQVASDRARDAASSPVDRFGLFEGIASLLASIAAKRSTTIVVEDIHWSDESTLAFLTYLAARLTGTRLLVIATHRVEEIETNPLLLSALTRIERKPTTRRVVLEPFGRSEMRALIDCALDGRAQLADALRDDVIAHAEGNPFFAEELLKEAVALGKGRARLPVSIRGFVLARVELLTPFERRVIVTAAVLGLRFDPYVLAKIVESDIDALLGVLRRARDAALIVEDSARAGWLCFRHALTRRVLYDDLLAFDARRLHLRILSVLENLDDPPLCTLAEHAAGSGDLERTVRYGGRAGDASWALGGYAEASTCFELALGAARDDGARASLMERLAFPVCYGGDVRRALRLWEEALEIRLRRGDYHDAARLLVVLTCERFNVGAVSDRGEEALAFVAAHGERLSSDARNRLVAIVACLQSELGHVEMLDALLDRIEEKDRAPDVLLANLHLTLANRAAYYGQVERWRDEVGAFTALKRIDAKPSVEALVVADHHASLAVGGLHLMANEEIERSLLLGRSAASDWGFERYLRHFDAVEAAYRFTRGDLVAARVAFGRAAGGSMHLTKALLARTSSLLAVALGDDSFVEQTITPSVLERDRAASREHLSSHGGRLLLGGYGVWLVTKGRASEAWSYLDDAFVGIPFPSPRFASLLTFALRHVSCDRLHGLETFVDTERLAAEDPVGRAAALLVSGVLARDESSIRSSAKAFERAGFPLCAAHAWHIAGETELARSLYSSCGAVAYERQLPTEASAQRRQPWPLSEREDSVADFVMRGLTNVAIAERMGLSPKTVEKHIASTFRKLGIRSRSQLAVRVADRRGWHGGG